MLRLIAAENIIVVTGGQKVVKMRSYYSIVRKFQLCWMSKL